MSGFGYKTQWIAVRSWSPQKVADVLQLREREILGWDEGTLRAYRRGVYVVAPVPGWTLVHGCFGTTFFPGSPTFLDQLSHLSRELGEVQFFGTHRVSGYCAWALALDGDVRRAYSSSYDGVELFVGHPTTDEIEMGRGLLDHRDSADGGRESEDEDEDDLPDEEDVMELAGRWSVDPTSLDGVPASYAGIFGIPPASLLTPQETPRSSTTVPVRSESQAFRDSEDRDREDRLRHRLGEVQVPPRNREQVQVRLRRALQSLNAGQRAAIADVLTDLGGLCAASSDHERALDLYTLALAERDQRDFLGLADTYRGMGDVYSALGDHRRAIDHYRHLIPLCERLNHPAGEANGLQLLSGAHRSLGDLPLAINLQEPARRLVPEDRPRSRVEPAPPLFTGLIVTAPNAEAASESAASDASNGGPRAFWHSHWSETEPPAHSIEFDLGSTTPVDGVHYEPYQDQNPSGRNGHYRIAVRADGTTFTTVAEGTWVDDCLAKTLRFTPTNARHVRLTVLIEVGDRDPWTSAGRLIMLGA